jgi:hypothetical protein
MEGRAGKIAQRALMRKRTVALLVLAAACSSVRIAKVPHGKPVLKIAGEVKGGPFELGEQDLATLPRRKVRGADPATGREALFEGADLAPSLARLELEKGVDTVVARTADRREIAVPLTMIHQARPVLADRVDGAAAAERVLAWPTAEQGGLASDPREPAWWAHGVVELDLVNGFNVYGRALAVPDGSPEGAHVGADLAGARCLACHRLRKVGGEKGPDLTRVAERVPLDGFRALLAGGHPGWALPGQDPPGDAAARQVWLFLKAVATEADVGPVEEVPPEPPRQKPRPPGTPATPGGA